MEDKQKSEARERLQKLIQKAASHSFSGGSRPPLSRADIDEIQFLSQLLEDALPPSFVAIAKSTVSNDQMTQIEFGGRLLRSLELHEKFGVVIEKQEMSNVTDELHPTFILEKREKERVLKLSSDIRKIIFSSTVFDEPHKRRLLNRIAAVENEVMQKSGKLDTVLAGISDVGDTLRKFGLDLKPLSDRYTEIVQIARSRSAQYEQLPAPEDLVALPPPEESNIDDQQKP